MRDSTLTQEMLKELLHYDPETGVFTWAAHPPLGHSVGDVAGKASTRGYVHICFSKKLRMTRSIYSAHRLAWLYVYGAWPLQDIDHIDQNKSNNALANLRDVSRSQNCRNVTRKKRVQ